jgi:RNA polymerase sigma factor (sigma-70 family)
MIEQKMLIWRFNRGDKQALHRIYEKYREDLLKVAVALLIDKSQVEDVVHDVFVSFARQSGSFRLSGSLKGYLAVSVANRVRDCNKRLHHQSCAGKRETESSSAGSDGPDVAVMKKELRQWLGTGLCRGDRGDTRQELCI